MSCTQLCVQASKSLVTPLHTIVRIVLRQHRYSVRRLQYLIVSCDLSFISAFDLFLWRTRQKQVQLYIAVLGFQRYDSFSAQHIKTDSAAVVKIGNAALNQLCYSIFHPLNKFRGYFYYPMSGKTASFNKKHSLTVLLLYNYTAITYYCQLL